ncbi:dihydrolipoyl dehydrogenase [Thiorhodospira sibirica]|uniref:dihydrolipoyl dehydrogenase n=1 Tax=Thiorhodospira sibirica TaxID=154347 RepID=UPI00022C10F6|nr:dihydrolipoyl dehydrogenase [Thiorhodospira sibirica]
MSRRVDVAIIGAGTAGLNAFKQVAPHKPETVLIHDGPYGTTCARVGCMPSKVLIEVAREFERRRHYSQFGITGAEALGIDPAQVMRYVREKRDFFVSRVMQGIDKIGARNLQGQARFVAPDTLEVNGERIQADKIIIATGSRPVLPDAWRALGERVITTEQFFELPTLPTRMAVIGLGAIGSELGQAMARLGVKVTGIEQTQQLAGLTDPVVNKAAIEALGADMDLWLGVTAALEPAAQGVLVNGSDGRQVQVDAVLASLGRRPNIDHLNLQEALGLEDLSAQWQSLLDTRTQRLGDWPIYVAGDAAAYRPILHEAADEGTVAGYNAARDHDTAFARRPALAIAFTDPQIAQVGVPFNQLDEADIVIGERGFVMQGRSIVMARQQGVLRVYAARADGRLLGAQLCMPDGEYIAHYLALAISQGLTARELLNQAPQYHPTLIEGLFDALSACVQHIEGAAQAPFLPRY